MPYDAEVGIHMRIALTSFYGLINIGGAILLFKLIYRRRLNQMGFSNKGMLIDLLYGFVMGMVSVVLVFIILVITGEAKVTGVAWERIITLRMLVNLYFVGMTAFSEEVFRRGYVMTALKTTRNKWIILLAPSVLFSLSELYVPRFSILVMVNTILIGILLSYMFIKSGKLWLPTGFHIAWGFFKVTY